MNGKIEKHSNYDTYKHLRSYCILVFKCALGNKINSQLDPTHDVLSSGRENYFNQPINKQVV